MKLSYGRKVRRSIAKCRYADEVAALLARRIKKDPKYASCKVETYGPFGLGAECSVSVKDNDKLIGYLTIKDDCNGKFVYVDYNAKKKNTYPKGSIGDINGFNRPTLPLPTDTDAAVALVFEMD